MALTSIGSQKTPGRPIEVTFAAETGLPSDLQELLLIGRAASGATGTNTVVEITNCSDSDLALAEATTKFGSASCELTKMVVAAVKANEGGSTFPKIKCCVLASTATDIPSAAQTAIKAVKAEFIVSPYDGNSDTTSGGVLETLAETMSGAQRVENQQFGTMGVVFNRSVSDPSTLHKYDSQFIIPIWLYDSGSPTYGIGEMAAACAAVMASNGIPFNPLDSATIQNVAAPASKANWPSVGAGLQSESALGRGWTPLMVKPNEEVAFVRTVTARLTVDADGVTDVTAYYDVQDFQVLYYWRKTIFTRFNQSDFKRRKASDQSAKLIKSELLRLATAFQDQNMFQAVDKLAKYFLVERNASDRHRFDVKTPVNVIPGLHVIATNVEATTQFDTVTV